MEASFALSKAVHISSVRAWATAATDKWAAVTVLLFGVFVLYGVAFSDIPAAHNATHDTRHANGFPCH